jgi:hypothetical protein
LDFPEDTVKKPQYFGHVTNDIIYAPLAPNVLDQLKKETPRAASGRHKHQLHRRLTEDFGHLKLREHLEAVLAVMKLSDSYSDFIQKLDRVKQRYDELPFYRDEPQVGM